VTTDAAALLTSLCPAIFAASTPGCAPGTPGFTPSARMRWLTRCSRASPSLTPDRHVMLNEIDGTGPFCTQCGALTGTYTASPGPIAKSRAFASKLGSCRMLRCAPPRWNASCTCCGTISLSPAG